MPANLCLAKTMPVVFWGAASPSQVGSKTKTVLGLRTLNHDSRTSLSS